MSTILCLAATHLSVLHPQKSSLRPVCSSTSGKSASLFGEQLSSPITSQNSEALNCYIHPNELYIVEPCRVCGRPRAISRPRRA